MALIRQTQQNNDYDLQAAKAPTVLSHTIQGGPSQYQIFLAVGDGSKNLNGSGNDTILTATLQIGSIVMGPNQEVTIPQGETRAFVYLPEFPLRSVETINLTLSSDNASDSDVDVTADLFEVTSYPFVRATVQGSPSVNEFDVSLLNLSTPASADALAGRFAEFVSGGLAGQARPIVRYENNSGTPRLFTSPFTAAPSASDELIIR